MNPLEEIRVLDLTRLLPGAVCTMMLADMGADVIKVEDPNGGDYARWMPPKIDDQSVYFRMNNRNKRSIILNLKAEDSQAVLKKLIESADVLVEGFRPGVMERLGCGYESLSAINPRLVYCSLSGWGVDGPYAQHGNHDINYVALAGLIGAMQMPQVIGAQIADIGGAYIGVSGILAALFRRERTGQGGYIDTSLAEAALPFGLYNWVEALFVGSSGGNGILTGGQACYHVYTTKDGKAVAIGALEEKFWSNFCHSVGRPDLIEGYLIPDEQPRLIATVQAIFAAKSASEWNDLLSGVDCCFTLVKSPAETANDPHFQARKMLGQFEDGSPWMRSPIRVSNSQAQIHNQVPDYGEHTRDVLLEYGYTEDEIETLKQKKIIQ